MTNTVCPLCPLASGVLFSWAQPLAGCAACRLRDPWEKGEDPRAYKPDGTKVSEVRKNREIEGKEELAFQIRLFSLMQSPCLKVYNKHFQLSEKNRVLGFREL